MMAPQHEPAKALDDNSLSLSHLSESSRRVAAASEIGEADCASTIVERSNVAAALTQDPRRCRRRPRLI